MRVGVLGRAELDAGDGGPAALSFKLRVVLAALVLHGGAAVSADALIDQLWPKAAPRTAANTLQGYISTLRRLLEPDRPPRAAARVLITADDSYRLVLPDHCIDAVEFAIEVEDVHRILTAGRATEITALEQRLTRCLSWWRGTPYAELGDAALAERGRLEELRLVAIEDRASLRLAAGQQAVVAGELEPLVREHPFRESLQAVHATALAAAGRQAEALAALRRARDRLAGELGAEPGPEFRHAEMAILRQEVSIPAPGTAHGNRPEDPPLIGRDRELGLLVALLDPAEAGRCRLAVLTGEAGIGKSRLARAVCDVAVGRGFAISWGRCVEDDGAPPLWPWTRLLRDAGGALEQSTADPLTASEAAAAQFEQQEAVAHELVRLSTDRPAVAVLEDVQWADVSSARLLRHLAETLHNARLLLLVTRRPGPPHAGVHADAAEALARRSSTRIDLGGLDMTATAAVVEQVTGRTPDPTEVRDLHRRTRGNPLFLLELARSPRPQEVPASIGDIVSRRLGLLPDPTRELVWAAAVLGEVFDLQVVADSASVPKDQAPAVLEPALAAGVIRAADRPDEFGFSHALVRDAVDASIPPSRRADLHAAVAQALERVGHPTGSTAARHWLAAGPRWSHRAWQSAAAAAREAAALHAYDDAAGLMQAAVGAADLDPGCSQEDRFDLLLSWLRSCAAADDRVAVLDIASRAVGQAWRMDDPRRAATAAVAAADGTLWVPRAYGVVDEAMVDTLRRALHALPADDADLRCRVMLVLAAELYYAETPRERAALVDEGLAMARRIDDSTLLAWACLMYPNALCSSSNAADRHAVADEAVAAARRAGSRTMLTDALTHRAGAALELGRIADFLADETAARRIAEGLQLAYPLVALDMMLIPWRAMQGRFDDAEALSGQLLTLLRRTRIHPGQGIEIGALLPLLMWQGKYAEALDLVLGLDHWFFHVGRRLLLGQAGRLDELRASWDRFGTADPVDDWIAMYQLCEAAATASLLDLRPVGAQVYRRLAPFAGTVASAGASGPFGPVDTYLALAASAAGETRIATRHADDALALCADWGLPVCAEAIRALRRAGGF